MTTHEAINLIVTGGTLSKLKGVELAVLLHYVARADRLGVAWPSSETIASSLGHNSGGHVRAARRRLIELELLERLPREGMRAPYRLKLSPRKPPDDAAGNPAGNGTGPNPAGTPAQIGPEVRPESGRKPGPNPAGEPVQEPDQEPVQEPGAREAKASPGRKFSPPGFVRWWSTWPDHERKFGEPECLDHWLAEGLEAEADRIVEHTAACARSTSWHAEGGRWVPTPLKYLVKRRYDAKAPPPAPGGPVTAIERHGRKRDELEAARQFAEQASERDRLLGLLTRAELEDLAAEVRRGMPPDLASLFEHDPTRHQPLRWKMHALLVEREKAGTTG